MNKFLILARYGHTTGYVTWARTDSLNEAKELWLKACLTSPIETPLLVKVLSISIITKE